MFELVGTHLPASGVFAYLWPIQLWWPLCNDNNQAFDAWLRQRDARSGLRGGVVALAKLHGMQLQRDEAMPANNHTRWCFVNRCLSDPENGLEHYSYCT